MNWLIDPNKQQQTQNDFYAQLGLALGKGLGNYTNAQQQQQALENRQNSALQQQEAAKVQQLAQAAGVPQLNFGAQPANNYTFGTSSNFGYQPNTVNYMKALGVKSF